MTPPGGMEFEVELDLKLNIKLSRVPKGLKEGEQLASKTSRDN